MHVVFFRAAELLREEPPQRRRPSSDNGQRAEEKKRARLMAQQAIVGEKVGMTQKWVDDKVVPVTVVKVDPMRIVQIKTAERDGYTAIQVTYGSKDAKKLNQPEAGHFSKAGVEPGKRLVELRLDSVDGLEVGQQLTVEQIAAGTRVDVTGTSRGKGFAGVMKRHNFRGAPASHGAHKNHRKPGAIGQCAFPARVFKGMKMAGHMGHEQVTTQNLEVVESDAERNVLLIKGAVPGPAGGVVTIRNAVKLVGKGA
jgi:large subunit ribosomal protein L3